MNLNFKVLCKWDVWCRDVQKTHRDRLENRDRDYNPAWSVMHLTLESSVRSLHGQHTAAHVAQRQYTKVRSVCCQNMWAEWKMQRTFTQRRRERGSEKSDERWGKLAEQERNGKRRSFNAERQNNPLVPLTAHVLQYELIRLASQAGTD